MTIQLEVLGSEPAWPSASRACSGYLLRTPEATVLLDCGTGIFERLRARMRPEDVTAVVISHLHFDHWVDLIPYRYYLTYEANAERNPGLYLPPGGLETLQSVTGPIDGNSEFFTGTFGASEYDPTGGLEVGDLSFRFYRTRHPVDTHAMRVDARDGVLVFSSDTGPDDGLGQFARDADVFLCEASWGADGSYGDIHLTALEAARLARIASAKRLVLTHLADRMSGDAVAAARGAFDGEVSYASPGSVLTL